MPVIPGSENDNMAYIVLSFMTAKTFKKNSVEGGKVKVIMRKSFWVITRCDFWR